MNRTLELLKTDLIEVERFDHPPGGEHEDPSEEPAGGFSVSFVERGQFTVAVGKREEAFRPGNVFLTWPGMVYRCSHDEAEPTDICLSVFYRSTEHAQEIVEGNSIRRNWRHDFSRPASNRLRYLRLSLSRMLSRRAEAIAMEALASELLLAGHEPEALPGRNYSARQLAWYTERIEAARQVLDVESEKPHSLSSLAERVNMSPFHFARIFSELAGIPPHRYLQRVRLAKAREFLLAGMSVTESCFRSGFNHLSHFSRQFRRHFGVHPSRIRG